MDEQEIKEGLSVKRILAQFKNDEGQLVGTPLDLPIDITPESLAILCNVVLQDVIIIKPFTLHTCSWTSIINLHPLVQGS